MRMEAKNSYCKKIGQSSNFKNVPYTVAMKHQRLLCSYLHDGKFFDIDLQHGPGMYIYLFSIPCILFYEL